MDTARIAECLAPYLDGEELNARQLEQLSTYVDILLKWNARMNLTSVRDPHEIVTRHFGESLFAGRYMFHEPASQGSLADVGSGAGFPGLPIAIVRSGVQVTLIEARGKKAVFLKECARAMQCANVKVVAARAEDCVERFDVVTFRAVDRFAQILPVSAALVNAHGRLAVLLGASQVDEAEGVVGEEWSIEPTVNLPDSSHRCLWTAIKR